MTHARAMTKGSAVKLQIGAALAAVTVVSFAILQVSSAAFSDTTDANGTWSAAEVQLSDNDWGGTVFTSSDMVPNATDQACIDVTYDGSVASNVKLYGSTTTSTTDNLGKYLNVTIDEVDIGTGTCEAPDTVTNIFNADLAVNTGSFTETHTDWNTGLASAFAPDAAAQVQTYRFTVTLADDNNAQGQDTTATFAWEAQNL